MGLFSFLNRERAADAAAAPQADLTSPDSVRARARRRLIGAAILVVAAVVVLPVVFDSKPRPLPVDIAIDIPKRDAVALPSVPPPRASAAEVIDELPEPAATAAPKAPAEPKAASNAAPATPATSATPALSAAAVASPEKPVPSKPAASATVRAAEPAVKPAPKAPIEPVKPPPKPPATRTDAERRALALLEGQDAKPAANAAKPAADGGGGRFVVQVGAFEQATAAKDARQRVEKLGLPTFVQEITTPQGKRIRVRLGPFASRDEAEKAQSKLGAGGIQASIVPL